MSNIYFNGRTSISNSAHALYNVMLITPALTLGGCVKIEDNSGQSLSGSILKRLLDFSSCIVASLKLETDTIFHPLLYNRCNYLSISGLKLRPIVSLQTSLVLSRPSTPCYGCFSESKTTLFLLSCISHCTVLCTVSTPLLSWKWYKTS